jgi:hypothetical protein
VLIRDLVDRISSSVPTTTIHEFTLNNTNQIASKLSYLGVSALDCAANEK